MGNSKLLKSLGIALCITAGSMLPMLKLEIPWWAWAGQAVLLTGIVYGILRWKDSRETSQP